MANARGLGSAAHKLAEICLSTNSEPESYIGSDILVEGGPHSVLGPSASYRWLNCTPSVRLIERLGKLEDEDQPENYTVTRAMVKAVKVYVDYVRKLGEGKEVYIEKNVTLDWLVPDLGGTADFVAVDPLTSVNVVDYKNGQRVSVEAEANTQQMIYALGILGENNDDCIEDAGLAIVQPNDLKNKQAVREWGLSVSKLYEWAYAVLKPRAEMALRGEGTCCAGPWCNKNFCPMRTMCEAFNSRLYELKRMGGGNALPKPEELDTKQLAQVLDIFKEYKLTAFKKECEARAKQILKDGGSIEGWKTVAGSNRRSWSDQNEVIRRLSEEWGEEIFDIKLKSVKQLEDLIGDTSSVDDLIKSFKGMVLAKDTDKREAVNTMTEITKQFDELGG